MIIISNKNIRFSIFTHIEKCAGMSLCKLFDIHKNNQFNDLEKRHNTIQDDIHIMNKFFKKIDINQILFFTCLRNPWDRMLSFYHYIKQLNIDKNYPHWSKYHEICKKKTFTDFILYANDYPQFIGACKTYKKRLMYKKYFLCDYIINFHNIYSDIIYLKNIFSIPKKLSIMNSSNHKLYKTYYNSKTIDIVKNIFNEDIEFFNFCFEKTNQIRKPPTNYGKIDSLIYKNI